MKAVEAFLGQRRGKEIADEDEPAYFVGWNDFGEALLSDATFYGAGLTPGEFKVLEDAVEFVRTADVETGLI